MRKMLAGFALGILFAFVALGAVTTFSQIQGRGTYAAGYLVLPRCPTDTSGMEFGALCARVSDGAVMIRNGQGLREISTSANVP